MLVLQSLFFWGIKLFWVLQFETLKHCYISRQIVSALHLSRRQTMAILKIELQMVIVLHLNLRPTIMSLEIKALRNPKDMDSMMMKISTFISPLLHLNLMSARKRQV